MALSEKTLKVLDIKDIPAELIKEINFLEESEVESYYLQVHVPDFNSQDKLDIWVKETYPELLEEDSFLLYVN